MSGLPTAAAAFVESLPAIDLATLEADAELAVRTDRKHLLGWAEVTRLLESLATTHRALERAGARRERHDLLRHGRPALLPRTCAGPSPPVQVPDAAVRGHRRLCVGGQAPRLRGPDGQAAPAGGAARAWMPRRRRSRVPRRLPRPCPADGGHASRPSHTRHARRRGRALHAGLRPHLLGGRRAAPGLVIVESKSERGRGVADRALLALGSRPAPCSKYCLGIALQKRAAAPVELRPLVRQCAA